MQSFLAPISVFSLQTGWSPYIRAQLLTRLTPEDPRSLEVLNRRLWAWVEGEYHHTPHRALEGQTPLERWASRADDVHFPDPTLDLDEVFLLEAKRKVQKDRKVSLNGVVYELDAALVGETVTLRYDPAAPPRRPIEVWHPQQPGALARPLDTYANCFLKRHRPSGTATADTPAPQPPPSGLNLRELPPEENR